MAHRRVFEDTGEILLAPIDSLQRLLGAIHALEVLIRGVESRRPMRPSTWTALEHHLVLYLGPSIERAVNTMQTVSKLEEKFHLKEMARTSYENLDTMDLEIHEFMSDSFAPSTPPTSDANDNRPPRMMKPGGQPSSSRPSSNKNVKMLLRSFDVTGEGGDALTLSPRSRARALVSSPLRTVSLNPPSESQTSFNLGGRGTHRVMSPASAGARGPATSPTGTPRATVYTTTLSSSSPSQVEALRMKYKAESPKLGSSNNSSSNNNNIINTATTIPPTMLTPPVPSSELMLTTPVTTTPMAMGASHNTIKYYPHERLKQQQQTPTLTPTNHNTATGNSIFISTTDGGEATPTGPTTPKPSTPISNNNQNSTSEATVLIRRKVLDPLKASEPIIEYVSQQTKGLSLRQLHRLDEDDINNILSGSPLFDISATSALLEVRRGVISLIRNYWLDVAAGKTTHSA
eukprot:PhF_6_TR30545/c1_g1_i1/m.44834